jgi:hypothetical protein
MTAWTDGRTDGRTDTITHPFSALRKLIHQFQPENKLGCLQFPKNRVGRAVEITAFGSNHTFNIGIFSYFDIMSNIFISGQTEGSREFRNIFNIRLITYLMSASFSLLKLFGFLLI